MATAHGFPLGPGPRPTSGDGLATRIRAAAATATEGVSIAGNGIDGLDGAQIAAMLDGDDIESLAIDLTGVGITLPGDAGAVDPADAGRAESAAEITRTPAHLRTLTVTAHQATLAGAPVDLDLEFERVPIEWVERADGTLELDSSADAAAWEGANGAATIAVAQVDLAPLATQILNVALADVGASVSGLELRLTSAGVDAAELDATAKAKYGVIGAKVRFRATASIVDGDRIRLTDLDLSSGNLLAGALLGLAKGELEKLEGQEVDLAAYVPGELGAVRAHLDVTAETVTLRATVGR